MAKSEAHVSTTEVADDASSFEREKTFGPIQRLESDDHLQVLGRQSSTRSSILTLERSVSLGDGYTHPRVYNDRLQEPEEEEKQAWTEEERARDAGADFVVAWAGPGDPDNPRNMSYGRKWLIVIIMAMGSLCVACASSMYIMAYPQLIKEFGISRLVATLGLSSFIFGLGVGPLFLAPLSEFFGRRIIYIVSFFSFILWLIPCAVAQNIQTLIVSRFFNGLSGSAFLSVAGGTVGDMFERHQLAAPMMVYTASPFLGPEIGPL
ncbi:hypothetical protein PRK78_003446 [Emydomyces testavorans]|uniref:Major facilitator superfamily (MFS) profile domain-containing protein n=1 Tax=Emydomyces testavorans TaxID=2070801 RepID=A0AAF0DGX0_9EURO|nr:hypothetical protein PRK78_003446 [Emydomyces testavorans]